MQPVDAPALLLAAERDLAMIGIFCRKRLGAWSYCDRAHDRCEAARQGAQRSYVPVQSASIGFTDDSELVHYFPSTATVAALSLGTKLSIPAGAVNRPTIFNVGIAKVGDMFPKIDILPYIALKRQAHVEVPMVRSERAAHDAIVPIAPAGRSGDARCRMRRRRDGQRKLRCPAWL